MDSLEKRIEKIEQRNKEKESDKAWETSITRRMLLATFTFMVTGIFMNSVGVSDPWQNAAIATVGFILSTLGLTWIKGFWAKYIYKH